MVTPIRILLIEDDLVDQMAFTAQVAKANLPYAVQIANSIREARQLLHSCVFDLIIADYSLGDGTTFELFDQLEGKLVLIATGAGDEEIAMRALRLGVRDYLIKDPERRYLSLLSHRVDSALHQWRSEQALRESEERYRELFESTSHLIQSTQPDGTILFVNPAWQDALGYHGEELNGLNLHSLIHPSAREKWLGTLQRVLQGESVSNLETTFVNRTGQEILVEGSASGQKVDGRPVSMRAIFHDVTAQRRAEAALKAALTEKEVLIQEIHHRVKNNLQFISSLLNLQARDHKNPEMAEALNECQQRIRSMALIHEMLYQSENFAEIDFGIYLHALIPALLGGYSVQSSRVRQSVEAESIRVRPQTAVPLALIVNELVTNSLKHAFGGTTAPRIAVECRRRDRLIELTVRDNGAGLPPDFSIARAPSLGLRLVELMVRQISARLETRNQDGAWFQLTFSLPPAPSSR